MILIGLVMGAAGAGLIRLGVDERMGVVVSVGAGFAGSGLASVLIGLAKALQTLWRRSRQITVREYRRHREQLLPALVGCALAFFLVATVAGHNWIAWYEIERDCQLALDTDDPVEALVAWWRATEAMESSLLLIPSDLFDLWGPNRCRSAADKHGFPPGTAAEGAPEAPRASSTSEAGPAGRPQLRKYNLRDQGLTDAAFAAWLADQEPYNGLTTLVLDGNRLTGVSVEALATSDIGVLHTLLLADNPIGDRGAEILASAPAFSTVTILYLSGTGLTPLGLGHLFGSDSVLGFLIDVDLSRNALGDEGARIIAGSTLTESLTNLYLDATALTDRAAEVLADSPRLGSLDYLSLDANELTEAGVAHFREHARVQEGAVVFFGERFE
jgi:hypothetical protein